jgi:hypothetical protein
VVVGYLLDGFRMRWVVMVSFGLCCAGTVPLPLSCATVTSGPFSGKNPSLWPYDVTGKI